MMFSALVARVKELAKFPSVEEEQRIVSGLRWIGVFDKDAAVTPRGNLLDTLCATLEQKMQYEKGERDMVMLQHSALQSPSLSPLTG
jgi:saccharopine dehydrogenase-like NADP-dependent oxidoreductase